jgi:4-amino-4-deoxy-L-arabinose transferase-like glycosyltransferase
MTRETPGGDEVNSTGNARGHLEGKGDFGPMNRRDIILLAAILLLALALRIFFFQGIFSIDDFNYLRYAAEVWKGHYEMRSVLYWHGVRPLMFVPVSWIFPLFGVSEASAVVWPLLASLITVLFVFLIGRMIHNRESAFYAAIVAAFLPMFVEESTWLKPGAIINLLIAVSAYCFIRAEHTVKARRVWLLLSGMIFAAMPWTGDLGLVFACFFPLAVLLYGRSRITCYWPAVAGFVGVLLAGFLYQYIETGDPLFNITIGRSVLTSEAAPFRPVYFLKLLVKPLASHGGALYLAIPAALAAIFLRRRGALLVTAWFIATWLFIEFGSSSLTEYRPLFKTYRYLSVVAVPGSLLAGIGLEEIRKLLARSRRTARITCEGFIVAVVLLALLLGSAMTCLERSTRWKREIRHSLAIVRDQIRARRGETIYVTHWLWNTRVGFFMGFEEEYFPSGYDPYHAVLLDSADPESRNLYVQTLTAGEEVNQGLLVHDERLMELSVGPRRTGLVGPGEIPVALTDPPDTWRLVERVSIDGNSVVALYEIPSGRWLNPDRRRN